MNEFALATNRTITLGDITLRQVVMAEFDQFVPYAHGIRQAIQALKDEKSDNQVLVKVFLSHSDATTHLLVMLTNLTLDQITVIANEDPASLMQLVYTLYSLNAAYFDEVIKPQRRVTTKNKSTWFDGFQFLIDHGHQHSQIMQYSYGTYLGYMEAAGRAEKRQLKMQATAIRTAQHADKNGFEKFNREFDKE